MSKSFYLKIIFITVVFSVLILSTKINAQVNYSFSVSPSSGPAQQGTSISATVWNNYIPRNGIGIPRNGEIIPAPAPAAFDFNVSVSPSSGSVTQGSSVSTTVIAFLLSGATQSVSFSASGLPSGVTTSFSPISCSPTCSSTLTFTASSTATTGTYTITITGTGGGLIGTTTYSLTVTAAPAAFDFSVSVSPSSGSVTQGSSVATAVTASLVSGTTQSVSFSASGLPSGVTTSFSPISCSPTCSPTLTFTASSTATTGTYTITITGTGGGLIGTTTYSLTVTAAPAAFDFNVSVSPSSGSVTQGSSVSTTVIAFLLSGATQSVSFSASGLPSGVTTSFSPISCSPTCSPTLTFTASSTATTGTYTITITGTGGGLIGTTTYSLTVTAAPAAFDFSVSVSPSSGSVVQGSSVSTTVTASLVSGTTQSVSFSVSGLPSGVTTSFSPISCSPTCSSTLTFTASSTATIGGPHTITITGAGGGLIRTTTYSLTVTAATAAFDFSVSVSPSSGSVARGSSVSTTVTASLVSGTTQSVSFSVSGLPSGVIASFSPISCSPTCSSTLTFTATSTATTGGPRTITITGTGGGLNKTTNYSLTVTAATAAFDFSVSVSPTSGSVTQGSSVATAVTASLVSGATQSVSFSASGLPSGVTTSFSPNPCSPTCSSTLTFTASSTATTGGPHTITITGTGGGLIRTTTYSLTVSAPTPAPTPACIWVIGRISYGVTCQRECNNGPTNRDSNGCGTPCNTGAICNELCGNIPGPTDRTRCFNECNIEAGKTRPWKRYRASITWGYYEIIGPKRSIVFASIGTVCSTADKFDWRNPTLMRPGRCVCGEWGSLYKACCRLGADGRYIPVNANQKNIDNLPPPEAYCPAGSTTFGPFITSCPKLLTVSKAGTGSGTVTGNGINCGTACSKNYPYIKGGDDNPSGTPQTITLTASAASGSVFTGWSGACSGTGTCTVTMNAHKTVTAIFNLIDNTKPTSSITSPANNSWQRANFSVAVTDSDTGGSGLSTCYYRVWDSIAGMTVSQAARTCNSSFTVTVGSGANCRTQGIGTCAVRAWAVDRAGNSNLEAGSSAIALHIDWTVPTVGSITPTSAIVNTSTTFSSSVSDNMQVTSCSLHVGGINQGSMTLSLSPCVSCTASRSHTFTSTGTFTMSALCSDLAGNTTTGSSTTITVSSAFDFSLSVSPTSGSVTQGASIVTTLTVTLLSGVAQSVGSFSCSGLPAGASCSFSPASCTPNPTCTSTVTLATASTSPAGTYSVTISGTGGGLTKTTNYSLTVCPLAPSSLTATAVSTSQINLSWTDNSTGETGFEIERCTGAGCTAFALVQTTAANVTSWSNTGLAANTLYRYRVRAIHTACNSGYSNIAEATTQAAFDFSLSVSPSSGSVTQGGSTATTLTVRLESGAAQSVGSFSCSGLPAGASCSFSPASCTPNPTCTSTVTLATASTSPAGTYSVTISGTGGGLTKTTNYSLTVCPLAPSSLTATAVSTSQINLSWTDNSTGETGFEIERCTGAGCTAFALVQTTAANVTSWSNTGLAANTLYRYRVRAIHTACNSGYSNIAEATTQAAFDFSLSVSPSSGSVTQGGSTATTLTVRLESGAAQSVGSFSCSGLPSGVFCSFVPTSCNPTCTSIVILTTASTSPAGTYSVTISGTGGGLTKQTFYSLTVTVANQPPSAINLSVTQPNYCVSGPAGIFSWTFTDPDVGDSQSAYQVQVDNNSNFSSPEADSGKVNSNSNSFATLPGQLRYNTTYYWRLKVWDSKNVSSAWISGPSFTTPLHAYPTIDFTWSPQNPSVNEEVQFTDRSTVHGGSTKVSWSWTFQDGDPATSSLPNPRTKFTSTGAKIVSLRVFDSTGYSCLGSKTVNILLPLPEYREVPPR